MNRRAKNKVDLKAYKRQLREKEADEREQKTGMRQSSGAMMAKIIFGGLFIVCGFVPPSNGEWSLSYLLTALVVGGALLAWGIIPYMDAKKKREHQEMKEILSIPLQSFHDVELQQAMDRVDNISGNDKTVGQNNSPEAEELKKYKDMLDQGLISEKDYEKKKKKILNI